jgi:UDP-glucose 4-epimerase
MGNNYLVTGGAGFIGSHLIEKLVSEKHNVICVDDLSTGFLNNLTETNLLKFLNIKIQDLSYKLIKKEKIDAIFHLAAQASVPVSMDKMFSSSSNNLLGTLKVFDLARLLGVPIVYASSSAVYGNMSVGNDEINKFDILSPYSRDKLTMEDYSKMCWDIYNVPSIGLRFFNVYGPRQDPSSPYSGVISIFIDRLLRGKPVIVNGGYQTRDFIFVDDIVDVISVSMKHLGSKNKCEVLNVGTGVSVKINEVLTQIALILKIEPDLIKKELPTGDPVKSVGTYKKLKNVLNTDIHKFVQLDIGLFNTIKYIKNEIENEII